MDLSSVEKQSESCSVVNMREFFIQKKKKEYVSLSSKDLVDRIGKVMHSEEGLTRLLNDINKKGNREWE